MMRKYGLPLLAASAFCLLLYVMLEQDKKVKTKYKYRIETEHQVFRTNSYTKSTDGCIQFLDRGENPATACGNYTIEQTRIK